MSVMTIEELDRELIEMLPDRALLKSGGGGGKNHVCQGGRNTCSDSCTGKINVCNNCVQIGGIVVC